MLDMYHGKYQVVKRKIRRGGIGKSGENFSGGLTSEDMAQQHKKRMICSQFLCKYSLTYDETVYLM
jgi:hypothetical protein